MKYGWVPVDDVVAAVREPGAEDQRRDHRPGRPRELIDVADTVTEMRKVKHAYDQGIKALKGIEY